MEYIDIDNWGEGYSDNDLIFNILKDHIEYKDKIYDEDGNEVNLHYRLIVVCSITGYLTNEKLLNHTLDVLRSFGLIGNIKEDFKNKFSSYSEIDVIKIKAIYYSLTALNKLSTKTRLFSNTKDSIPFDIKLENRVIKHNLEEVQKSLRKKDVKKYKDYISKLPIVTQEKRLNEWIRSVLDISYDYETNMFDDEITHLEKISKHLIEPETPPEDEQGEVKENMKVIALLYYYNYVFITRDNAQEIAVKYKYTSKTSGDKLYQNFVYFKDNANRKASGERKTKCKNRITLQERVIKLLINNEAKAKAETELKILETKLETLL